MWDLVLLTKKSEICVVMSGLPAHLSTLLNAQQVIPCHQLNQKCRTYNSHICSDVHCLE